MFKYYYIIPKVDFFLQGRGGAVSHVIGLFHGLVDNDVEVKVDGCQGVDLFLESKDTVSRYEERSSFSKVDEIYNAFSTIDFYSNKNSNILHFRKTWSILLAMFLKPLKFRKLCKQNHVIIEVNGLSFENKEGLFWRLLFNINSMFTSFLLSVVDVVYVVSPSIEKTLLRFKCKSKIVVVPNGSPPYVGLEFEAKGATTVLFYGKFRAYNEFSTLKSAFNKLQIDVPEARLMIVGFGPERALVEELFTDLEGCEVRGAMSLIEVRDLIYQQGGAMVGVVPVKNASGSDFLSPIKLFDYFSLGLPGIVSDSIKLTPELLNSGAVMSYKSGSSDSLYNALVRVLDITAHANLRRAARDAAIQNGWGARARDLLNSLDFKK